MSCETTAASSSMHAPFAVAHAGLGQALEALWCIACTYHKPLLSSLVPRRHARPSDPQTRATNELCVSSLGLCQM